MAEVLAGAQFDYPDGEHVARASGMRPIVRGTRRGRGGPADNSTQPVQGDQGEAVIGSRI